MDLKLKTISKSGIAEAIAKAELYRYLNEPEEAESICRDILAADPKHMLGLRSPRRCLGDALNAGFGYPCKRSCPVAAHHQDLGK